MFLLKKHPYKKRVNIKAERAKEMGHVVKAYKVRGGRVRAGEPNRGTYEYAVNGKKYRFSFSRYGLYCISRNDKVICII